MYLTPSPRGCTIINVYLQMYNTFFSHDLTRSVPYAGNIVHNVAHILPSTGRMCHTTVEICDKRGTCPIIRVDTCVTLHRILFHKTEINFDTTGLSVLILSHMLRNRIFLFAMTLFLLSLAGTIWAMSHMGVF